MSDNNIENTHAYTFYARDGEEEVPYNIISVLVDDLVTQITNEAFCKAAKWIKDHWWVRFIDL